MRLTDPLVALAEARPRLFPLVPVFFACGIGLYFWVAREPGQAGLISAAAVALLGAILWRRGPERWQPLALIGLLLAAGFLAAAARSHHVAAPVLGFRYYGPIEGRIVGIDRSLSDQIRLTLDRVVLENMSPQRTPHRVRVALHGEQGFVTPEPGLTVILTGHLSPPELPAEPGGFDFQRLAWFDRLGAVGYTRSPVLALSPPEPRFSVFALRMRISQAVRAQMPGDAGAFAAAVLTGDRSGIPRRVLDDLRASNLAHLLAISGLHMGLLTGLVFGAMRYGLALIPPLALRLNAKKLAALVALGAGAFYLMLSGGNVATQRAFVMVAVFLGAVLLDQRAISLRSVAMAAMLILVLRPEALLSAGFQMSFAATVALVAAFSNAWPMMRRVPRVLRPAVSLCLASAVAGAATAPVAAAHFGRMADYGLLANLLSVPLMGSVIIPGAVLSALLVPVGLWHLPLRMMELGTSWVLGVAAWVAGLDGAVRGVVAPSALVLPVLALGALWLIVWPGRLRWLGVPAMIAALAIWTQPDRPALLVASSGGLLGLITDEGRALSKASGEGFVARSWLESDGDLALPAEAHARWPAELRIGRGEGVEIRHLTGRGAVARLDETCTTGRIVILSQPAPEAPRDCLLLDAPTLGRTGAVAFHLQGDRLRLRLARREVGERIWNRHIPPVPELFVPEPVLRQAGLIVQ
ncbi:ComEC/Rec2 family competence protein [Halodurantibacterium flavum]|uniref:ComEC/Rec2 family competence protein n=1 Tax=Halodurantibacterium flavum TaxID=1382802 RepID=A0ABW4S6T1_9RHOB